jgi:hypothetical protein
MQRLTDFIRHSAHLWFLLLLIVGGGVMFLVIRSRLVPASYGEKGSYRADALQEIAAKPSRWHADADCLACHASVAEERSGSLHEAVRCFHCHGIGTAHVQQARLAAEAPETQIPAADAWDGDFLTSIDLYVTKDKAICLSCHQNAVGMPADFKKIDVAAHLEEQERRNRTPEVCSSATPATTLPPDATP